MLERIFAGAGTLAALAASTCCVLPLGLGAIGLGSAWLSALSVLAPYQSAFQVVAILSLGAGFWMVYGRRIVTGDDASPAARVRSQRVTKLVLWLGVAVMGLVLTSGWWQRFLT